MKVLLYVTMSVLILLTTGFAQNKDTGKMAEKKNEFWDKIEASCDDFAAEDAGEDLEFQMDFTGKDLPTSVDQFEKVWYNLGIAYRENGNYDKFIECLEKALELNPKFEKARNDLKKIKSNHPER